MNPPLWSTSSDGDSADTKPSDLAALREHQSQCTSARRRLVAMQCAGLKLRGFVLGRLVTTLALLAVLVAALMLVL